MATFTGRRHDVAEIPHPVEAVWELLVDPQQVARMTPLVHSICLLYTSDAADE